MAHIAISLGTIQPSSAEVSVLLETYHCLFGHKEHTCVTYKMTELFASADRLPQYNDWLVTTDFGPIWDLEQNSPVYNSELPVTNAALVASVALA